MVVLNRKFEEKDIENKIKWINDYRNNTFLHYDIPLEYEKTLAWYEINKSRKDRYDAVIEVDGISCGLIGLLSIDYNNKKAEYYITIGEHDLKGKGIAQIASVELLNYAFNELCLHKIYLYTEVGNIIAQKLFERIGFKKEGMLKADLYYNGKYVDRFIYGLCKEDYLGGV